MMATPGTHTCHTYIRAVPEYPKQPRDPVGFPTTRPDGQLSFWNTARRYMPQLLTLHPTIKQRPETPDANILMHPGLRAATRYLSLLTT